MGGYIMRGAERDVVLRPQEVDRLLERHDGDAALLYLCLRRTDRGVTPKELTQRLGWSELKLSAAEHTLQELGLLDRTVVQKPLQAAEERAVYTAEDLAQMLSCDGGFQMLVPQTEEKLGKKLKTADLQILAGLYDDLAMPPDVIYLLVSHCVERSEKLYGTGRRPSMRQIEREGFYWARLGIFDQERAAAYLKDWAEKQGLVRRYMQVLGLGNRDAVASEQKYIMAWIEQGFPPEVVALAYDKTIFYTKELKWAYLNSILKRWHEKGWHTVEAVEQGDLRDTKKIEKRPDKSQDEQIDKYMKW